MPEVIAPYQSQRNAMSVAEFCKRNCISKSLFYLEAARGNLAFFKVGTKTLVTFDAERQWLARCQAQASSRLGQVA